MKREIKYIVNHFQAIQDRLNTVSESDEDSDIRYSDKRPIVPNLNGQNLLWRTPGVFWVNAYEKTESYEGSAIQIGLTKDGLLVWEAQSHCSCYGWHNSELQETKVVPNFKAMLDAIEPEYEHDAITDGETPTHLSDVEQRFNETLKDLITLFKRLTNHKETTESKQA